MEIYRTPGIRCGDFWRTREGVKRSHFRTMVWDPWPKKLHILKEQRQPRGQSYRTKLGIFEHPLPRLSCQLVTTSFMYHLVT